VAKRLISDTRRGAFCPHMLANLPEGREAGGEMRRTKVPQKLKSRVPSQFPHTRLPELRLTRGGGGQASGAPAPLVSRPRHAIFGRCGLPATERLMFEQCPSRRFGRFDGMSDDALVATTSLAGGYSMARHSASLLAIFRWVPRRVGTFSTLRFLRPCSVLDVQVGFLHGTTKVLHGCSSFNILN
jgi:hypothetical protein